MTTRAERQRHQATSRTGRPFLRRGDVPVDRLHSRSIVPILPISEGKNIRETCSNIISALALLRDNVDYWINAVGSLIDEDGRVESLSPDLVEDLDGRYRERIRLGLAPELTINASGVIFVTRTCHRVDTYQDAASDDLDTINGGKDGDLLVLRTVNAGRDVVVTEVGNIALSAALTLGDPTDKVLLIYDGSASKWTEVSRSLNG